MGSSPRQLFGLGRLSQAWSLHDGREFVLPDDMKRLAAGVLAHRLVVRSRTVSAATVIDDILASGAGPVVAGREAPRGSCQAKRDPRIGGPGPRKNRGGESPENRKRSGPERRLGRG